MALDKTLYTATETVTDLSTGEVVSLVEKKQ